MLAGLAAVALTTSRDERRAGLGVRETARAFYAAEAGLHGILGDWKTERYDQTASGSGDSAVVGWRTLENGATYRGVIRRVDDGTGAGLYSVRITGRGSGPRGAHRGVATVVEIQDGSGGLLQVAAMNDYAEVGGGTEYHGACSDSHVNGDYKVGSNLTTAGEVSATGTVEGSPEDFDGDPAPAESGADSVDLPDLDPTDYCGDADYRLRNGYVVTMSSPPDSVVADESFDAQTWGYKAGDRLYELKDSDAIEAGTWCADGDVKLAGGIGAPGSPLSLSLFSEGHIEADGNSMVTADHPDGFVFMSGGDLMFSGGSGTAFSDPDITGVVYAGAECELKGSTNLLGQLVCFGRTQPGWSEDLTGKSKLGGGTKLKNDCSYSAGGSGGFAVVRRDRGWRELF